MVTKLCVELTSSCLLNMLPTIDMPRGTLRHPAEVGVPEKHTGKCGRGGAAALVRGHRPLGTLLFAL